MLKALLIGSLASVLGVGAFFGPAAAAQGRPPAGVQRRLPVTSQRRAERHPEIRLAMRQLETAQRTLDRAADDFGGHKAKAKQHIREALDELREALRYDRH